MGYTHYIKNKPAFTDEQWIAFCNEVRTLFIKNGKILAGANGDIYTKPHIGRAEISFNGIEDESHETCGVIKNDCEFDFCKTARKPYDAVVVEVYKLVRKYLPTTELSSDGGDEIFGGKKIMVGKYTYLSGEFDVKVGDVVLLPHGHRSGKKYSDGAWEGEVTAIGSDYDGECKYILEIIQKAAPLDHLAANVPIPTTYINSDELSLKESIAQILVDYEVRDDDVDEITEFILGALHAHLDK